MYRRDAELRLDRYLAVPAATLECADGVARGLL
jgi:hypothetical protein